MDRFTPYKNWADEEWGRIVKCVAVPESSHPPYSLGTGVSETAPLCAPLRFECTYENGARTMLYGRVWEVLTGQGLGGKLIKKGNSGDYPDYPFDTDTPIRFYNDNLIATILDAVKRGTYIPKGNVSLLDDIASAMVVKKCGVPTMPCKPSDDVYGDIMRKWNEYLKEFGLVTQVGRKEDCLFVPTWLAKNKDGKEKQTK